MASEISPKAEIAANVKIGDNCKIYPFAYIEDDVVIGDNCIIYPFTSVLTGTRMGNNNQVFQGSWSSTALLTKADKPLLATTTS